MACLMNSSEEERERGRIIAPNYKQCDEGREEGRERNEPEGKEEEKEEV